MDKPVIIGGTQFFVGKLKGTQTFKLQPMLMPAVSALGGIIEKLKPDSDVTEFLPAIAEFFQRLPADDLVHVMRELLSNTYFIKDGSSFPLFGGTTGVDMFDHVMQGRTLDTWHLLWESLRLNYADFFAALGGSGASLTQMKSPIPTPMSTSNA